MHGRTDELRGGTFQRNKSERCVIASERNSGGQMFQPELAFLFGILVGTISFMVTVWALWRRL
jgi:hypothetical protein